MKKSFNKNITLKFSGTDVNNIDNNVKLKEDRASITFYQRRSVHGFSKKEDIEN